MMRFLQRKQFVARTANTNAVIETKKTKRIWPILVLALFTSVFSWLYLKLENPITAPIQTVNIGGDYRHINTHTLQKIIAPYAAQGFFAVDLDGLKDRLQQVPWVEGVSISRIWPHTLDINIVEQQAQAEWNDDSLLNTDGVVFSPLKNTFPAGLVHFYGPIGQQDKVQKYYYRMQNILEPLHLRVVAIELTARQAWRIKLSNGIMVVLGREEVLPRVQRLVMVYSKIIGQNSQYVNYIDMRYINGIAVSWKPVPQSTTSQTQTTTN